MCIFRAPSPPPPAPLPTQPPPMSRTNPGQQAALPTKKELVDPDEIAGVEYGTTRKKQTPAAGKKTGTAALRIPLSTGQGGTGTGGMNV
tara:strand:- start:65 stop:331 length:267 start_codon:yes stop_codon:yes gene_type:complete